MEPTTELIEATTQAIVNVSVNLDEVTQLISFNNAALIILCGLLASCTVAIIISDWLRKV